MKLIIDTDMGIDDACALILALPRPEVEILAITAVFGNVTVEQAVANASRVRKLMGRDKVPIYAGAPKPLIAPITTDNYPKHIHGMDGLGDSPETHPRTDEMDFQAAIPGKNATQAIIDLVHANPGCTMICIGPLTNLALAIKMDPTLSDHLGHLFMMGGNMQAVGNVPLAQTSEFNFFMDPEAAHIVLSELQCPITAVPWETYLNHPCSTDFVDTYTNFQPTAKGRFVHAILKNSMMTLSQYETFGLCDEMVTACVIDPSIVLMSEKRYYATVELHGSHTRGQVVIDYRNYSGKKPNVEFITKVDIQKAQVMLLGSLEDSVPA